MTQTLFGKIQKLDNGYGVYFNEEILETAHFVVGDEVTITVQNGKVTVQSVQNQYRLEALVEKIPENYSPVEENWGKPAGKEVW